MSLRSAQSLEPGTPRHPPGRKSGIINEEIVRNLRCPQPSTLSGHPDIITLRHSVTSHPRREPSPRTILLELNSTEIKFLDTHNRSTQSTSLIGRSIMRQHCKAIAGRDSHRGTADGLVHVDKNPEGLAPSSPNWSWRVAESYPCTPPQTCDQVASRGLHLLLLPVVPRLLLGVSS